MINSRSLLLTPAIVAVSLLSAGCGGSAATSAAGSHRSVLAYVRCMHTHGVPNFPDPEPQGGIDKSKVIALGSGPEVRAASNACAQVMPSTGLGPQQPEPSPRARFADAMAFARCVRAHGFPSFPDPTSGGQLTPEMITAAGINLHQPAALRAGDACVGASHGAITRAAVARAVSGS